MKQSFNENWICYKTGDKENAFAVTLPHDAMQLDERSWNLRAFTVRQLYISTAKKLHIILMAILVSM